MMKIKKSFYKGYFIFFAIPLCTVLISFAIKPANAQQYPKFYACIANATNEYINYRTQWCTRSDKNCSSYKTWNIQPNSRRTHWGDSGVGKMRTQIHTGGGQGYHKNYAVNGTTEGCRNSSTGVIKRNDRGFLRIYDP